jgi:hypothetical protein
MTPEDGRAAGWLSIPGPQGGGIGPQDLFDAGDFFPETIPLRP